MKILFASRNSDKFELVKRMVEATIPDARLVPLAETTLLGDVVEVGTISQRAIQKAEYFLNRLRSVDQALLYDAVLAVDDGVSIGQEQATPNSKEVTDQILQSRWPVGQSVTVERAFALIKRGERARAETTRVPFIFVGNTGAVTRESGKYPLSRVLAPVGYDTPVYEMSDEERNAFNLAHSADALKRLFA